MEGNKKSQSKLILLLIPIIVLLGCLACLGIYIGNYYSNQAKQEPIPIYQTFADRTEREEFQDVPIMPVEHVHTTPVSDYGDGSYGVVVSGTALTDYEEYLGMLKEVGFDQFVDNGKQGLEESIYMTMFTKGEIVLTVTQVVPREKTYIVACKNLPISEHLIYRDEYVEENKKGAKTTLHMLEEFDTGNSYVIQLKNGHFIINDGGTHVADLSYLLDYLESLTPKGEKPVVEAWFISHAHLDHYGAFIEFIHNMEYTSRLSVEGVYYTIPSLDILNTYDSANGYNNAEIVKLTTKTLRTSKGEKTPMYRPQSGQRYYFSDITIDILHTPEQIEATLYNNDLNDSSIWCMYTIDNEKFLLCGDADKGSVDIVMKTFDSEYFELKAYSVFHHGINVWKDWIDYITYDVALYPSFRVGSQVPPSDAGLAVFSNIEGNEYLVPRAKECFAWGKGTVVLEFPYALGTGKILPPVDWTHYTTEDRTVIVRFFEPWKEFEGEFEVYVKNY